MSSHDLERETGWYWLAYYADWSGLAVFETEIDALRYAVDRSMQVMRVPTHADIREYVQEHR